MRIWVICIGTELLRGHTLNTNLAFLGEQLGRNGYAVEREICIPDTPAEIFETVAAAWKTADLTITVGGLGPTSDDLTKQTVCRVLGRDLVLDAGALANIREIFSRRRVYVSCASIEGQAMIPAGAVALPNRNGTAPGIWCEAAGRVLVMLPGPPREFQPLVTESLLPRLLACQGADFAVCEMHACGMPESRVAEAVEAVLSGDPDILPAYCARYSEVDVRLTIPCAAADSAGRLAAAAAKVQSTLGDVLLEPGQENLAAAVLDLLRRRGRKLAVAESCTGGGLAAALTDAPGASDVFQGGVVSYANAWKRDLLGVPPAVLETHGAVSAETAGAMLDGLREKFGAAAGIAVTGIAGPGGGSPDKPVGLVFIGSFAGGARRVERFSFPGNRATVRARAVAAALNQLRRQLLDEH